MPTPKTFEPENQFMITCPVFKAPTRLSACFELREIVWRGDKPPVRRGCQVAMHACKCPINDIVKDACRDGDDPYYSATPKIGALRDNILERISPVLVLPDAIERANLPPKEAKALYDANDEAREGVKKKKRTARRRDPTPEEIAAAGPVSAEEKVTDETIRAATTGDMSAAINAEIKETKE
jgi:hypothetical protein